jgi:carboxyl-terminal processing protease
MSRYKLTCLALAVMLLLTACDPFEDGTDALGSSSDNGPSTSSSAPTRDAIDQGGETLLTGLTLLNEHYVGGADLPVLFAESQRGAWQTIAESGVLPRDVDSPAKQAVLAESSQMFRQRYNRMAARYASKVDPRLLAHEMLRRAADSVDDCHTGFLSAKQMRDQVQRMSGVTRFGGIGVILRRVQDGSGFMIVEVFEDGPAAKAGLQAGDYVVTVDDEKLDGYGIEQVVNLVRGAEGASVKLGITRGTDAPFDVSLVRAQLAAPVLKAQILDGEVGYLHPYAFPEPLTGQVDQALREFERRNVKAVIVDLRDNSGGQLDVVTKVTSRFVKEGALFQGVGLDGQRTVYKADGSYWRSPRPLVVLVNNGTGSGGEIFAAAIKEHRAGVIVGTTTAGCVSTGQMFPLPDGSAIEIATNRVISGLNGAELNKYGVAPDVTVPVGKVDVVSEREQQLRRALEIIQKG